jgi:prolyl oligopeptidase
MKSVWLMLALGVTLVGMNITHADGNTPAGATTGAQASDDPFLWLEDIHGARAMDWVKTENAKTTKQFIDNAEFDKTRDRILEVLDSDARIPAVSRMGDYLYNFWRDKANPRGIWRRTTLAEYRKPAPQWEVLLDIDALNKAENKRWVFKGSQCLKPAYTRCLLSLSPDGGDAVTVREFDIPSKSFVKDGFVLPVAKTEASWIDENTVYVGTDFGPGTMTASSYPRIVKEWKRGTPIAEAKTVYEGKTTDLAVGAMHDRTPGFERDFVSVAKDFFHSELYQRKGDKLSRVDVPTDASADAHREWLLVQTRSAWTVGGETYPSGALLAANFDAFMAGKPAFTVLFKPDAHTSLESYAWTRHHLILDVLDDVKSRLEVLTPPDHTNAAADWKREAVPNAPALSSIPTPTTATNTGSTSPASSPRPRCSGVCWAACRPRRSSRIRPSSTRRSSK